MITHPTASELLDAVIGFIEQRAAPQLTGRDAFLARVAVNALGTVKRELQAGDEAEAQATERLRALLGRDGEFDVLNAVLTEQLRCGETPLSPEVLAHLKASVIDEVLIDQPNYSGLKALLDH